jgi:ADP-ribose pyrophosphatase YjhB (NUDIX family)
MKEYLKNLRKIVGHMPILVCGASVIVENDRGEILLILRSDNKKWAYPGGSVDLNEVVEEAAKRELFEETGIIARSLKLFGVFSGKELFYVYPHGDEISNVDIVYLCNDYTGDAKADLIESDEVGYFAIDNLPKNISPPCVPALKEYIKSRLADETHH